MNRNLLLTVVFVALTPAALFAARGEGFFDGGWRISAGGVYSSPVKAKMGLTPSSLRPESHVPIQFGRSQAEAEALAKGGEYDPATGRTTFPNGAWYERDDGVGEYGGANHTWKMHIPAGNYLSEGNVFSLGNEAAYGPVVSSYVPENIAGRDYSDSSAMFGLDLELSRELYRNEEHGYGLDVSFGVIYFFRNKIFKSDYGYQAGHEDIVSGGTYEGTIAAPDELPDPRDWYWNDDGSYGRGGLDTEYNGGPVFDLGSISAIQHVGSDPTRRNYFGAIHARGDYRELDLILSVRPYYDVTDWLRLYGTLGAVVSRDQFKLNVTMADNGLAYGHTSRSSQWDVHGIGGLGAMLRYKDFTLAGDFLARFLDDDLSVHDRYVHGCVEHGHWMLKLTLGYEF